MSKKNSKKTEFKFDKSLVLFKYIVSLFNAETLNELCDGMKTEELEGVNENIFSI